MNNFVKLLIVLFAVCGLAAGSLALVNELTKETIETFKLEEKNKAMRALLPEADEFKMLIEDTKTGQEVWEALRGTETIGTVVKTSTPGYGGAIELMIGIDSAEKVSAVGILSQNETPGLGARIKDDAFLKQFAGLPENNLTLRKTGGDAAKSLAGSLYRFPPAETDAAPGIDAITGATISSRAVLAGVRKSYRLLAGESAGADEAADAATRASGEEEE